MISAGKHIWTQFFFRLVDKMKIINPYKHKLNVDECDP
jgi:hypothetical protein